MTIWKCSVCGYEHDGKSPPEECPQCSSLSSEFLEKTDKPKLKFDGKKFDVLLINGSSHKAHNTGFLVDIAEEELKTKKVSYRRFNLNELEIRHCWCCYSMENSACTYPCRDQLDDMPALHDMLVNSKAVIVASPINWNQMSARLKDFLDRTTSIQNRTLLGKKSLTAGKTVGIIVTGHEDGAVKTAMDIFVYFQQMGYIMAPFGFTYRTHSADNNTDSDNEFLRNDKPAKNGVEGVVNNVVEMIKLDVESKIRDKVIPVSE